MSGDQQDRVYTVHVYMVYSIPGVVSSLQVGMSGDQQDMAYMIFCLQDQVSV